MVEYFLMYSLHHIVAKCQVVNAKKFRFIDIFLKIKKAGSLPP